ncbi:CHASE2 domain-containing protein [bacterium]|nr:CHASE2 domain-containing protein [bacterium]
MPLISLVLRIALCSVVAFLPLPGLERWCSDALFWLRGVRQSPTPITLVRIENSEITDRALARIQQSHPRQVAVFTAEALREDTLPDDDYTVRHANLEGGVLPSPTLLSYHRLIGTSGKTLPKFPLAIDFRGPAGSYPTVSEEVFFAHPPPDFADKIVLLGPSGGWPRTAVGKMSALELQANTLDTLWQGRALKAPPQWLTRFLTLLTIAASVASILWLPLQFTWLALALLTGAWVAAGVACLAYAQVSLNTANPLVALLFSHLLLYGFKVRRREAEYWRVQKESEYSRQLEEFKNNFISLFSHDLKTPIARIKAICHGALSEPEGTPAKTLDSLKNINRASEELSRLISDILKVTKMESMSLEVQRDAVDLNRTVELAVARLKHLAEDKRVRLVLDLEPLFPIEGDPQLVQEIVLNLAENGVKYSQPGNEVLIRTKEEPGRVRVTVEDQGAGIPEDELPRVTGKFYRARNAAKQTSGSGLGLFLAKYFVELHHGGLEIQSQEGRGTTVSFWLPSPN